MATIKIALITDNVYIDPFYYRIDSILTVDDVIGNALIASNDAILFVEPVLPDPIDCECHVRLHSIIDPLDHDNVDAADYNKLVATNVSTGAIELITKPDYHTRLHAMDSATDHDATSVGNRNKIVHSNASTGAIEWIATPPGGSGTLNYISKWTPNGTTLGNSQIFDDATYVGFATAVPTRLLDVNGAARVRTLTEQTSYAKVLVADTDGNIDYINKTTFQTALTNPVTGTGTTNYVAKFTGTSAIGNSMIFDNATYVGVNTAIPTRMLDVNGAARIRTLTEQASYTNVLVADADGNVDYILKSSLTGTTYTVANEATDTTCFPLFNPDATGTLAPKTNANLTYNSNTGLFTSTYLAVSSYLASVKLKVNLAVDAGLSSRNVASESIVQFGNNHTSGYTGTTDTSKAGAMLRLDTRNQDGGSAGANYTVIQFQTREAGANEALYQTPFQICPAPTGAFIMKRTGVIETNYGIITTAFKMTTGAGAGKYLMSDGDGDASWETFPSNYWKRTGTLLEPTTANDRVKVSNSENQKVAIYGTTTGTSSVGVYGEANGDANCLAVEARAFNGGTALWVDSDSGTSAIFYGHGQDDLFIISTAENICNRALDTISYRVVSGNPSSGIGLKSNYFFDINNDGIPKEGASFDFVLTTVTNDAEKSKFVWKLIDTDVLSEKMSLTSGGLLTIPSIKITTGAGLGKVLTSDADGDATWETASGGSNWNYSSNIYTPKGSGDYLNFESTAIKAIQGKSTHATGEGVRGEGFYAISGESSTGYAGYFYSTSAGMPLYLQDASTNNLGFIYYNGGTAANFTESLSTLTGAGSVSAPLRATEASGGWIFEGMVKVLINNVAKWMPYYASEAPL